MKAFRRWLTAGIAAAVLAGAALTAAQPVQAQGFTFIPNIAGYGFDIFIGAGNVPHQRLQVDTQDANGNFTGTLTGTTIGTVPVTGTLSPGSSFPFQRVGCKIVFSTLNVTPKSGITYEGSLNPADRFMAGTYSSAGPVRFVVGSVIATSTSLPFYAKVAVVPFIPIISILQ